MNNYSANYTCTIANFILRALAHKARGVYNSSTAGKRRNNPRFKPSRAYPFLVRLVEGGPRSDLPYYGGRLFKEQRNEQRPTKG